MNKQQTFVRRATTAPVRSDKQRIAELEAETSNLQNQINRLELSLKRVLVHLIMTSDTAVLRGLIQ